MTHFVDRSSILLREFRVKYSIKCPRDLFRVQFLAKSEPVHAYTEKYPSKKHMSESVLMFEAVKAVVVIRVENVHFALCLLW